MSRAASAPGGLLSALGEAVGPAHCITDPDRLDSYTTDWTGRFRGEAVAAVRPASNDEVAAVLLAAGAAGAAVIPQGGKTGLVGGSVPRSAPGPPERPQVVLSTSRLGGVSSCDRAARLLDAGAGTILAEAQQEAGARGMHLGIDIAARGSATLGGMVATNAGGMHVMRYGPMRARLAGLEAVLADGTVATQMSGLVKDNVGWDLPSLLAGSEGTLAVVTRVLVRTEPQPAHRVTALAGLRDAQSAVALAVGPLSALASVEAVELTLQAGMQLVREHASLAEPPGAGGGASAWLTVEATSDRDPTDELAAALDDPGVLDVAVGMDAAARERLWAYRERHTDGVSSLGVPHKLDVSVRPERLHELVDALPAEVEKASPGARLIVFGHVADGNLHVNVVGPAADDSTVDDAVFRLVLGLGGSISAEHGVGVAKARWLSAARSPGTLEVMRRVKRALDPAGVLNPGIFDEETLGSPAP